MEKRTLTYKLYLLRLLEDIFLIFWARFVDFQLGTHLLHQGAFPDQYNYINNALSDIHVEIN